MAVDADLLPAWVTWQRRPFPDANLLLLHGRQPALVDSGFVGHAQRDRGVGARARPGSSRWSSTRTGIPTTSAATRCCRPPARASLPAPRTPMPSPGATRAAARPSTSTNPSPPTPSTNRSHDGQVVRLGDADWQVVRTPGHTPGHLSLWQPDERLLVVGDALSDYDVGWVNLALDGPDAAATALASLHRLVDLTPRVLLPAHGPIPADPGAALAAATTSCSAARRRPGRRGLVRRTADLRVRPDDPRRHPRRRTSSPTCTHGRG